MIEIYISGKKTQYTNYQMNKIQDLFFYVIIEARSMPALSVAIDDIVKKDINRGVWMSIKYPKQQIVNEMPFDELLIKIDKNYLGFNIIRGNKGVYDGRCFYLDNDIELESLHTYILTANRKNKNNVDLKEPDDVKLENFLERNILKVLSY